MNRADLVRHVHGLADKLKVNFETPPPRRLLYHGGTLEHGEVDDFKKNLLRPSNIRSHSVGAVDERPRHNFPIDHTGDPYFPT